MAAVATAAPFGPFDSWRQRDAEKWSNVEVRGFLGTVLPGHDCALRFGHTTGRVLCSLSKDDLRRQARDEEATNVIWGELQRLKEAREAQEHVTARGAEQYTIFIRTPMDLSVELQVTPAATVAEVNRRLAAVEGTPVEQQRLTRNGIPMLDARTLASYNVVHGAVLLLVPRLASHLGHATSAQGVRYAPPPGRTDMACGASSSGFGAGATAPLMPSSGIPRPRVPVVCTDIARPFPMSIEFQSIPEYQSFMLALQREAGRRGGSNSASGGTFEEDPCGELSAAESGAPFLEILPADRSHEPVQTRITFDAQAEVLLIDTVGDILLENARYGALLHLRDDQKLADLVTGVHGER